MGITKDYNTPYPETMEDYTTSDPRTMEDNTTPDPGITEDYTTPDPGTMEDYSTEHPDPQLEGTDSVTPPRPPGLLTQRRIILISLAAAAPVTVGLGFLVVSIWP